MTPITGRRYEKEALKRLLLSSARTLTLASGRRGCSPRTSGHGAARATSGHLPAPTIPRLPAPAEALMAPDPGRSGGKLTPNADGSPVDVPGAPPGVPAAPAALPPPPALPPPRTPSAPGAGGKLVAAAAETADGAATVAAAAAASPVVRKMSWARSGVKPSSARGMPARAARQRQAGGQREKQAWKWEGRRGTNFVRRRKPERSARQREVCEAGCCAPAPTHTQQTH